MGDGQTAYLGTMHGLLFRYRAGESQLEPLPLIEDRGIRHHQHVVSTTGCIM